MHRPCVRHLAVLGAFALIGAVPAAACGSEALSPLPIETPTQSAPATPTQLPPATPSQPAVAAPSVWRPPVTIPSPSTKPATPQLTPTQTQSSTCWGAIRYDLDLLNTELALVRPMCFKTGGVLRLQGIGPGLVTAEPAALVVQSYEAAVVDIAFIRPGTVTVTIPQDEQIYTITVVVNA